VFGEWRICSDGPFRPVCKSCDVELNRIALRWAYPPDVAALKLKRYIKKIGGLKDV
jgi:hypothetical protein